MVTVCYGVGEGMKTLAARGLVNGRGPSLAMGGI